jgi:putative sterol carrier protein
MTSTIDPFADCAKLKDLTGGSTDVAPTFDAMANLLSSLGQQASVQFRLEGDEPTRTFVVKITKAGASVGQRAVAKPTLEIVTKHATWREIASGALSPLEAFARRRMRVIGSTQLGLKLLRHLRGSGGRNDLC